MAVQDRAYIIRVYVSYIVLSCIFTGILEFLHSVTIHADINSINFTVPLLAGIIFGYLLAKTHILSKQLGRLASTDALTGAYNRLQFDLLLKSEIDKSQRYGNKFCIITMDLDHFKNINDQYGHQTGDMVIKTFSNIIMDKNRASDIFARYGGEEFIILAREANLAQTVKHAERLCHEVANHQFGIVKQVTCSFGVTEFKSQQDTRESLLKRADTALYNAKENGRNRVEQL